MYSNTILVVNADVTRAAALRSTLEATGYAVLQAGDGPTAMNLVNGSEVALVVTELYVPVGKARCLVRKIRKSPALRRTRVLAYTSHGKRKDRTWAKEEGAQGYVITRSGEARLLQVIDRLMRRPRAQSARASATPT